ncbi:MAG: hypothetical protein D6767_03990 [Candidatus Hydrogenedentota bacterium]|nr:MAG: hypothetical protein D6767_03990 [Candidatus Hydrogenedentota bacterium]
MGTKPIVCTIHAEFDANPDRVWDYLSNTQRWLAASRLLHISFEKQFPEATIGFGKIHFVAKEAFPEWKSGHYVKRQWQLRRFLSSLLLSVELLPVEGSREKTEANLTWEFIPKGVVSSFITHLFKNMYFAKKSKKMLQRLQAFFRGEVPTAYYPIADRPPFSEAEANKIREAVADLSLAAEAKQKLADFLLYAFPEDLAKIRPKYLAHWLKIEENALLNAFLDLMKNGIFFISWHTVCPYCGAEYSEVNLPSQLHASIYCNQCGNDGEIVLDMHTEVTFRLKGIEPLKHYYFPHPFDPESLPSRIAQWRLPMKSDSTYAFKMPDMPLIFTAPAKKMQFVLQPDEKGSTEVSLKIEDGKKPDFISVKPNTELTLFLENPLEMPVFVSLNQARRSPYQVRASRLLIDKHYHNIADVKLPKGEMFRIRRVSLVRVAISQTVSLEKMQAWKEEVRSLSEKVGGLLAFATEKEYTFLFALPVFAFSFALSLLEKEDLAKQSKMIIAYGGGRFGNLAGRLEFIGSPLKELEEGEMFAEPKSVILSLGFAKAPGIKAVIGDTRLKISRIRKQTDPEKQYFRLSLTS